MRLPLKLADICARRPVFMAGHAVERRRVVFKGFFRLHLTNLRSVCGDDVCPACALTAKGPLSTLIGIREKAGMGNLPAPLCVQRYPVIVFTGPYEIEGER